MRVSPLPCLLPGLLVVLSTLNVEGAPRVKRSHDVTTDSPQPLGDQQTSLIPRMQARLTSLENQVNRLQAGLQELQNGASRPVAFTARISGDRDRNRRGVSLGYHQTVIFNDVITNIGNAYNHHTGIFTAPVAGTYVFFLTLMGVKRDIYLNVVKNGATLDRAYAQGRSDQGSTQVSTQLGEGDQVWVRQASGDAVRGDWWTVFTGYLIHAD